jgi:hypothetical protein
MAITKVRQRLSLRKRETQKIDVEKFDLKKLRQLAFRKQYQIEMSKCFAFLGNLK